MFQLNSIPGHRQGVTFLWNEQKKGLWYDDTICIMTSETVSSITLYLKECCYKCTP